MDKIRKAIDAIIDKDNDGARKYIKEGIEQNEKYLEYRELLKKYNLDDLMGENSVDDKTYDGIHEILKEFPEKIKLKILDVCYKEIAQPLQPINTERFPSMSRLREAKLKIQRRNC